ncbi:hypothetical protein M9434_003211 [Picochlorum sp. BPE23]|nr:hypothetical protein M9434_003211 [Picochlorum sp. BPE23]
MRGNVHSSRGENVLDRNGYQDIDEGKMRARRLSVYEAQETKTAIEEVSSSPSSKKKKDDDDDVAPIPQNTPLAAVLVTGDVEETKEQYTHDTEETDKHDDALFDAYKKFMVDRFTHESDSDSWRISSSVIDNTTHQVPCRRIDNQSLHEGQSYLASMKHVIEMKNRARRHHRGRQIATGVTRRFMHELHIAKENMCIHQRLLHITPSTDVDRKRHYKDFVKSRALLGKMSRYDMVHAMPHSTRPDWVDSF